MSVQSEWENLFLKISWYLGASFPLWEIFIFRVKINIKSRELPILFILNKPILAAKIEGQGESIMSNNVQGSNILDVLKKKMRATKEESEKYKEECEDIQRKLQVELMRREEVSRVNKLVNLWRGIFVNLFSQSESVSGMMNFLYSEYSCEKIYPSKNMLVYIYGKSYNSYKDIKLCIDSNACESLWSLMHYSTIMQHTLVEHHIFIWL